MKRKKNHSEVLKHKFLCSNQNFTKNKIIFKYQKITNNKIIKLIDLKLSNKFPECNIDKIGIDLNIKNNKLHSINNIFI